ncbi:glycosyltransferase [Streptomyces sp. GLT-R25]
MGPHTTMETEWAKASVAAVSSDWESFGMTILEAMHAGVPVVATDCPHGPGEIITDGSDGLLVPRGDADAFAAGLLKLIEDTDQRRLMGEAARESVQRFAPRRIADQYERLFAELREARTSTATKVTRRVRRALGALLPQSSRPLEAPPTTPPAAPPPADARPRALRPKGRCTTDADGGVRIKVNASGVSGEDLTLVLRHRHGDDETRVPLERPADPKSPWTANLSHRRVTLAEGRWDLHVERTEDGARRRLKAGLVEQRGLLTARPKPSTPGGAFAWWIPYATKDGYLALRTFRRPAHAEATALRTDTGSLTVEGTLHGAVLGEGAGSARCLPRREAVRLRDPGDAHGGAELPGRHHVPAPPHGRRQAAVGPLPAPFRGRRARTRRPDPRRHRRAQGHGQTPEHNPAHELRPSDGGPLLLHDHQRRGDQRALGARVSCAFKGRREQAL